MPLPFIRSRGHVLVRQNQMPSWLTDGVADGSIDKAELRGILEDHVKTVVRHFRGRVWQWDVVNEAVTKPGPPVDALRQLLALPDR